VNTLGDNIIQRGAPNKLISDRAQVIISNKVADILRTLCIATGRVNAISSIIIQQNDVTKRLRTAPIVFLIALVPCLCLAIMSSVYLLSTQSRLQHEY
jgi:hypothetical protein